MEDHAKAILISARSYSRAAKHINAAASYDPSQLMPSLVVAALALELYFKSLYFLEHNKEFKINGRHSHNFHALFGDLSEKTRRILEQNFQSLMTNRNMDDVFLIEFEAKVKVPRSLKEVLKAWSDVFTKARYMHEKPDTVKIMMFFPEIEQAVESTIFDMNPNFRL